MHFPIQKIRKLYSFLAISLILFSLIFSSQFYSYKSTTSASDYDTVSPAIDMNLGNLVNHTQSPMESIGNLNNLAKDPLTDLGSLNQYIQDSYHDIGLINPSTEDPIEDLGNLNPTTEDPLMNLGTMSSTTYIYTNSSDKLAVKYQVQATSNNYKQLFTCTMPEDSIFMVITGSVVSTNHFVNVSYSGAGWETSLGSSSLNPFTIDFPTSSGDPGSMVYPGYTITIKTDLKNLGEFADITVFSIRNYTYTNVSDQLSIDYNIVAPASSIGSLFAIQERVVFTIPYDAISITIEGVFPSSMMLLGYYDNYINLFNFMGGTPFAHVIMTSLGDPDSSIYPGEFVFLDLHSVTKGISATFTIQSTRSYTYFNSSDQLAIKYSATSIADYVTGFATIERLRFTLPMDAAYFYVEGTFQTSTYTRVYRESDEVTFDDSIGSFCFSSPTSIGDPLCSIYPGEIIVIDTFYSYEGETANFEVFSTRNYTLPQDNPPSSLGYEFSLTAPGSLGIFPTVGQILFKIPEDAIAFRIEGELTVNSLFGLYDAARVEIFSHWGSEFDFWFPTSIGEPSSEIDPGETLIMECEFTVKGEITNFTVYAYDYYKYLPNEDNLALDGGYSADFDAQIYGVNFTIPEQALEVIFNYTVSAPSKLSLKTSEGTSLIDSTFSGSGWFGIQTTILNSASMVEPGDELIFRIEFAHSSDSIDFKIYSTRLYEIPLDPLPESWRLQFHFNQTAYTNTNRRIVFQVPLNTLSMSVNATQNLHTKISLKNENGTSYIIEEISPFSENFLTSLLDPVDKLDPEDILYLDVKIDSVLGSVELELGSILSNSPPKIQSPSNMDYLDENETIYCVTWTISDDLFSQATYIMYFDGIEVKTDSYSGQSILNYSGNVSELGFTTHNWSLVIYDGFGGIGRADFLYEVEPVPEPDPHPKIEGFPTFLVLMISAGTIGVLLMRKLHKYRKK